MEPTSRSKEAMIRTERESTYEKWLKDHRGILFKVIRAYAFSPEDREDLFQEIALQLWRSVSAFREESTVATWIYRIALNTAMKWNGRQSGNQLTSQGNGLLATGAEYENEQVNWLYEQISRLSRIDRSIILLLLDGFSYREIANISGISESNAGVKIHRIKQELAKAAKTTERHGI